MSIQSRLQSFLCRSFDLPTISCAEDIFKSGYANSMFAMQLVMFLEKEFSVNIEDEDLNLDYFRTVEEMEKLVIRKQGI